MVQRLKNIIKKVDKSFKLEFGKRLYTEFDELDIYEKWWDLKLNVGSYDSENETFNWGYTITIPIENRWDEESNDFLYGYILGACRFVAWKYEGGYNEKV